MRDETFSVDRAGALCRSVVPRRGRPYVHRCELGSFEKVAHAIDEASDKGCTLEQIAAAEGLPHTQVAVAMAFLKERGCVVVEGRRTFPACSGVHIDAMIEFHALAGQASGA